MQLFQSSHSARSGTGIEPSGYKVTLISILPLREEWDQSHRRYGCRSWISILPLREEWDMCSDSEAAGHRI